VISAAATLTPIPGGANNRVYRVEDGDRTTLLKEYFHDPGDPRDRLRAEWSFSNFAWDAGVRALPQPLAHDPGRHAALYEWVEGRKLAPDEVDAGAVVAAAAFAAAVNDHRAEARDLPVASEACFSVAEHLATVERRVARLAELDLDLVRDRLVPAWERIRASVSADDTPLPASERCVSPSDFGFHNALVRPSGELCFLDFEYAGWDDPAKLVCDFFCQVALPAPPGELAPFRDTVLAGFERRDDHVARIDALLPVYRIKWACIVLNHFLPVGRRRRAFSAGGDAGDAAGDRQLQKAAAILDALP
jgi:Ser/Thr protein kinase RdoA (MazF antagonist)